MWSITHDPTLLVVCFLPLACTCGTGGHFWDQLTSLSPCWVTSEASALLFLPHLLNCFQPLQSSAMNFKKKIFLTSLLFFSESHELLQWGTEDSCSLLRALLKLGHLL